jgi:hypothetical protein
MVNLQNGSHLQVTATPVTKQVFPMTAFPKNYSQVHEQIILSD